MANVFPSLPGLAWSVTKAPAFKTRVQRAVSGRELRLLDQPQPIWNFTLNYEFLRDEWDQRGGAGLGQGYDELRTLMGFFLQQQGSFQAFLFDDPTDDQITGQPLPAAVSELTAVTIAAGGAGYATGDIVEAPGSGIALPALLVTASSGVVTGLSIVDPGALYIVGGSNAVALSGGGGSGLTANLTWTTTTQLQRTLGGFVEPIVAPNTGSPINLYYNGIVQPNGTPPAGWTLGANGVITLAAAFTGEPPAITADFSYYFQCRFSADASEFENFMYRLWSAKELKFQSVLP